MNKRMGTERKVNKRIGNLNIFVQFLLIKLIDQMPVKAGTSTNKPMRFSRLTSKIRLGKLCKLSVSQAS